MTVDRGLERVLEPLVRKHYNLDMIKEFFASSDSVMISQLQSDCGLTKEDMDRLKMAILDGRKALSSSSDEPPPITAPATAVPGSDLDSE